MKVLFQGDSITDAGRDRNDPHDLGNGYPRYAAAMIADAFPEIDLEFLNLGISGNRTADLLAREKEDLIDVQPDLVSVLLGINDVWHRHSHGIETTDRQFEENYRAILQRIRNETHAKILLILPFLLPSPDGKEQWMEEVLRVTDIVRRLASEYADAVLPLCELFAKALPDAPDPFFYSEDGVHPNAEGACFIGEQYFTAVAPLVESMADASNSYQK